MEEKRLRLATVEEINKVQDSPSYKLFREHVSSRVAPFIAAGYAVKSCSYQDGKLKVELYKLKGL